MKNMMVILGLLTTFEMVQCSEKQTSTNLLPQVSLAQLQRTSPIAIPPASVNLSRGGVSNLEISFYWRDVEEMLREELKNELPPVEISDDESDDDSDHVLGRRSQAEDRNSDEDTKK
jgi:hypothetical protein